MSAATSRSEEVSATPMMAQYLDLKARVPSALLFFRMGDFYELFFDDAVTAAEVLGIALTFRGRHQGKPVSMCGVPVHSHESYLARLVKAGHPVAIAEQTEDPKQKKGKGLVGRAIVRLLTPGTLVEERMLDGGRSNWLLAVFPGAETAGLAWADISTGALFLATVPAHDLTDEIARIEPAEQLWPEDDAPAGATGLSVTFFDSQRASRQLCERFGVQTLDGFGRFERQALAAAGGLLCHLEATSFGTPIRLEPPRAWAVAERMAIDAATRRSLELTASIGGSRQGSLIDSLDRTVTAAGQRLLAAELSAPLTDIAEIEARLDLVQWLLGDSGLRSTVRGQLRQAPDMARAVARIAAGRQSPRDLGLVRGGLEVAQSLQALLLDASAAGAPQSLSPLVASLEPPVDLTKLLQSALAAELPATGNEAGAIAEGFDPALDSTRALAHDGRSALVALEGQLRQDTGITALKVRHNNVIGYHLEVASRWSESLMVDSRFLHRQTLAGAMRFDCAELRDLASRISQAQSDALELEARHLEQLRMAILADSDRIALVADAIARLDRSAGLAERAAEGGWCRPMLADDRSFAVVAGRHPVVEDAIGRSAFVPNDCNLGPDRRLWLLTGPNMGGKSTFLRQNALMAVLAQMGSFVPAAEATIGIVDRVASRVGASDSLAEGRSTFMVEMVETAALLNGATDRSLLLLDEVGRGTATWDGLALAWAILETIHDRLRARCLFASHYHELTELAGRLDCLSLKTMRVKQWQGGLVFLHEVGEGAAPGSFGLDVARLAGIPADVLTRAKEILDRLERGEAGQGARAALSDLPLFAAAARPNQDGPPDPLRARLAEIHPDQLSPRAALDLIYELAALAVVPPAS